MGPPRRTSQVPRSARPLGPRGGAPRQPPRRTARCLSGAAAPGSEQSRRPRRAHPAPTRAARTPTTPGVRTGRAARGHGRRARCAGSCVRRAPGWSPTPAPGRPRPTRPPRPERVPGPSRSGREWSGCARSLAQSVAHEVVARSWPPCRRSGARRTSGDPRSRDDEPWGNRIRQEDELGPALAKRMGVHQAVGGAAAHELVTGRRPGVGCRRRRHGGGVLGPGFGRYQAWSPARTRISLIATRRSLVTM